MDTTVKPEQDEALASDNEMHFGEYLRQERLRQGISLEYVSGETGIKLDNLTALEAGQRRKLPADIFVRGFIRMYAKLLKMDNSDALAAYVRQWGFSDGLGNREFLDEETMAESGSIFRNGHFLFLVIIAMLVASCYLAFNILYPISQLEDSPSTQTNLLDNRDTAQEPDTSSTENDAKQQIPLHPLPTAAD